MSAQHRMLAAFGYNFRNEFKEDGSHVDWLNFKTSFDKLPIFRARGPNGLRTSPWLAQQIARALAVRLFEQLPPHRTFRNNNNDTPQHRKGEKNHTVYNPKNKIRFLNNFSPTCVFVFQATQQQRWGYRLWWGEWYVFRFCVGQSSYLLLRYFGWIRSLLFLFLQRAVSQYVRGTSSFGT